MRGLMSCSLLCGDLLGDLWHLWYNKEVSGRCRGILAKRREFYTADRQNLQRYSRESIWRAGLKVTA